MKLFVLALFVSVATANPGKIRGVVRVARASTDSDVNAPIVRSESVVNPDGFNFAYETGNGIVGQASGVLKKVDADNEALAVTGQFGYNSPDGPISLTYVADENGYQPQGSHLPVAPPIPELIARSLEYIAAHPPPVNQKL